MKTSRFVLTALALAFLFLAPVLSQAQCTPPPAPNCGIFDIPWANNTDCDLEIDFIFECNGTWIMGHNPTVLPANSSGPAIGLTPLWTGCSAELSCGWACPFALNLIAYGVVAEIQTPGVYQFPFAQFPHNTHCCPTGATGVQVDITGGSLTIDCY